MELDLVKKLVDEAINENHSLFLIDLNFTTDNKIRVVVDGDQGVALKECVRISRHIEHHLDRDHEDFAIEVNLNKVLKIKTEKENIEGTLVDLNEEGISLQWKVREPKPIGKGKITVEKNATIAFKSIKEAKVKITF